VVSVLTPGAVHELAAPVHRQPGTTTGQTGIRFDAHDDVATCAVHLCQVAGGEAALLKVVRVHRQQRLVIEIEQPRDAAGAAHAVPLVAQTAGEQADRVPGVGTFGSRLVFDLDETRPPAGSREDAVFVQALASVAGALGKRPLLRAGCVEQRVAQAGDVEVAPARALAMFDEDRLGVGVGKQLARSAPVRGGHPDGARNRRRSASRGVPRRAGRAPGSGG
jgi:hypothetical protein